jgi:hypothetical protein
LLAQEPDQISERPSSANGRELARVRDRSGVRSVRAVRPRPKTFLAEVHQAIRRAGGDPNRLGSAGKGSGRFNARGRGAAVAAGLKGRNAWSRGASGVRTRARRVTVRESDIDRWAADPVGWRPANDNDTPGGRAARHDAG